MRRWRQLAIPGTVAFSFLLIPIPYKASPQWTVRVVDEAGNPLQGMLVRLSFENYSVESTDHEVDLNTDSQGRVIFPSRTRTASILSRCYYTARSAMALAHASFGPSAYILVFGGGFEGSVNAPDGSTLVWNGKPDRLNSVVVARPREQ
jgi:hypothetical protein